MTNTVEVAQIQKLRAALREAMNWNWIDHYEILEEDRDADGNGEELIPAEVVDWCNNALDATNISPSIFFDFAHKTLSIQDPLTLRTDVYDLYPATIESEIRCALIDLGWEPPC